MAWHPGGAVDGRPVGVAVVQRGGVVPAFGEGVKDVGDRRPADLRHGVVPGRVRPVPLVQWRRLGVAGVQGVVASSMAQVDPADECHVLVRPALASHDDELLVVRPPTPYPLVEERLAPGVVDDGAEVRVLLGVQPSTVGAPQHCPDLDTPARGRRKEVGDGRPVIGEALVRVPTPVRAVDPVAALGRADHLNEPGEVVGTVHVRHDEVPGRPRPLRPG